MNQFSKLAQNPKSRCVSRGLQSLAIAGLMLAVATPPQSAHAAEPALPRFVTQQSTGIECDGTPFGERIALLRETELAKLAISSDGTYEEIDAFQLGHDTQSLGYDFEMDMDTNGMIGTTTVDMIAVDFNGDGRDEFVTAGRWYADATLRLGVFSYDPNDNTYPITADLIDTWAMDKTFSQLALAAGDFDGSGDGKQELAVLLHTNAGLYLAILTGDEQGEIVQVANQYAGKWERGSEPSKVDLTSGDFLLDGREQILVTGLQNEPNMRIAYHLIEFATVNPGILTTGQLGSVNVGSMHDYLLLDGYGFTTDDPNETYAVDNVTALETHAGNLTDSAADEIVTMLQFVNGEMHYLGMQLQHYVTARAVNNQITAIDLGLHPQTGGQYDSRIIVGDSSDGPAAFESAVSNIDMDPGAEVILARAEPNSGKLDITAYKSGTRFVPGFSWEANGLQVAFHNTSAGANVDVHSWDFDDGSSPVSGANPHHNFANAGTYNVNLIVSEGNEPPQSLALDVTLPAQGLGDTSTTPKFTYELHQSSAYHAELVDDPMVTPTMVNLVVEDMDSNGLAEFVTLAKTGTNKFTRTAWHFSGATTPSILVGESQSEYDPYHDITKVELALVDFDGDSIRAEIGTECNTLIEPQVRQLIWLPPYFSQLQAGVAKEASFGESTEGASGYEQRASSFTSHTISGFFGATIGAVAYGVEASVRATAGHSFQSNHGEIHGRGESSEVYQGFSQDGGEGLVIFDEYSFQCYAYNITAEVAGNIPDSGMRMCRKLENSREVSPSSAQQWDTSIPAGAPADQPPADWVPLRRDWASIALFHPVASNAQFASGHQRSKATDGMFRTSARSSEPMARPYLQVDLGAVRDISNIRIFPAADSDPSAPGTPARKLTGFRVYVSKFPMGGDAIPTGPNVHVFEPMSLDGAVFDRWNIWTREQSFPYDMLRGRYVRLQNPGLASLDIAEVQVFGDVHADPPRYPDAVCDEDIHDGYFLARVWDEFHGTFAKIEVHGELIWDGTGGPVSAMACTNDGELEPSSADIWDDTVVGSDGTSSWNLSDSEWSSIGESSGFENANFVGAEMELTTGFIGAVTTGASYEFSTGVSSEYTTSNQWSKSLELGGSINGFDDSQPAEGLVEACEYNPRPYAYHLVERSITGYQHDIYVVDYIVRQKENGSTWRRGSVPSICLGDAIFADGFD